MAILRKTPKEFKPDFTAYTDGGYSIARGVGASACVILDKDGEKVYAWSRPARNATNNKHELAAIIHAALHTPIGAKLLVISDSEYCIGVLSGNYSAKKNLDLIEHFKKVVDERKLDVAFEWTRSHSGDFWNEFVDNMCTEAMESL